MAYRIAGIDVHKKMVAVAIADVEVVGPWRFERRQIGTSPTQLRTLDGVAGRAALMCISSSRHSSRFCSCTRLHVD